MDKSFTCKIADFGVSRNMSHKSDKSNLGMPDMMNHDLSFDIGTPLYTAPEIISNQEYNEKVDVYSLGIIYIELLCSFRTQHERLNHLMQIKNTGVLPLWFKEKNLCEFILINRMLKTDPQERYSVKDVLDSASYGKLKHLFM